MMIFEFENAPLFLKAWVDLKPNKGRGFYKHLAEYLRVSPVLMSQILNGSRQMSEDQAYLISQYLGLTTIESDYFLLLVQKERAVTSAYKTHLEEKIRHLRQEAEKPKNRVVKDITLNEEASGIFYSHWKYSLIRLAASLPQMKTVEDIAEFLGMPRNEVSDVVDFLLEYRLCLMGENGIEIGPKRTHLAKESPYYFGRQLQLRQLAISALDRKTGKDLFYSAPVSISAEDIQWFREMLLESVVKLSKRIDKSEPTNLYCLNIDWFELPL